MQIRPEVISIITEAEEKVAEQHQEFASICLYNQAKVLKAFQELKITDECFNSNEGYGYNDIGREKLEALFAMVFKGEDAIVRPHLVSGTHTIYSSLKGLLQPGDRLLSITGVPYDTLARATGYLGTVQKEGNLIDWNIALESIDAEDLFNLEKERQLKKLLDTPTKVVYIQRSRGYNLNRFSLTIEEIGKLVQKIRAFNPNAIVFVDNCYGEFVEKKEPLEVGADILAGSLIKNPGGGLAPTGGYVVGKKEYIRKISNALSAPGLGKELGAFVYNKRLFFQGFFMAPHLTAEALKGGSTLAAAFQSIGYKTEPRFNEKRGDIVQSISLKDRKELEAICQAVQNASPINSHLLPVAGETPGYRDLIFMAGGTFVQGASSELSADAPLREPFTVYLQGGLTYQHIIITLARILNTILD